MALVDHLRELRNRLFKSAIGVILGTVAGFILYQPMLAALIKPITDLNEKEGRLASLNFDGVASSFDLMIQISVFMGLILRARGNRRPAGPDRGQRAGLMLAPTVAACSRRYWRRCGTVKSTSPNPEVWIMSAASSLRRYWEA